MSLGNLFLILSGFTMIIGIFGILTRKNIIKIILSINILQTGVNLLLVALGWVKGGKAPLLTKNINSSTLFVDPLPQALVLTSIVIGFGTTALALVIALRYYKTHKTLDYTSNNENEESEVTQ